MKLNRLVAINAAATVVLVALAVTLSWLVRKNDPNDYQAAIATVLAMEQLAADWSVETTRVRADPWADFDTLVEFVPQMNRLKNVLLATIRGIPDFPDHLARDVSDYIDAIDAKEERIERFKTSYAVNPKLNALPALGCLHHRADAQCRFGLVT